MLEGARDEGRQAGVARGRSWAVLLVGALAVLFQAACFIEVDQVSDARPAFRRARAEAEKVQGKRGPAHSLNVLVYDPDEGKLVRVSLPMWLCRKLEKEVDWDDVDTEWSRSDRDNAEQVRRRVKRHVKLEQIEKAGLGMLAEVEDDDGSQVLIWLK
jgi:hypothetical protein